MPRLLSTMVAPDRLFLRGKWDLGITGCRTRSSSTSTRLSSPLKQTTKVHNTAYFYSLSTSPLIPLQLSRIILCRIF
jgi:hypothetical protein